MEDKLVYIADDEVNICNIIKSFLVKEGYNVETFNDGQSILDAFNKKPADLLVIDVMMPKIDGFSLCRKVREKSSVPIIIVSAKDTETDMIAGLTLGGDDYLTKPFSPMELIARIKTIFRRIDLDQKLSENTEIFNIGDLTIDINGKEVTLEEKSLGFTAMEFSLFYFLAKNKNKAVSRSVLLDKIWGFGSEVETRAADDMIKRIRKKLIDCGSVLKIETIWGYGFRIVDKD
jgi:DNA-binding response OmpR family regulator